MFVFILPECLFDFQVRFTDFKCHTRAKKDFFEAKEAEIIK